MIEVRVEPELLVKADEFSKFRENCKNYLTRVGMNYDKFTMVKHDSIIGYISEYIVAQYLRDNLPNGFIVSSWMVENDIANIYKAVNNDDVSKAEMVKNYFYDKYDIKVTTPTKKQYCIDVKTALTAKEPSKSWDFMYPVIQAAKEGKEYAILAYCIAEFKKIVKVDIIGYLQISDVSKCNVIKAHEKTKFHTESQIDNYETKLGRDFHNIQELIDIIKEG